MMPRMMARPWSDTCTWPHRRAATPANDHESRVLHWSQRNGLADDGFGNYFSHTQGQAPAWSVRHETIVMAMAVSHVHRGSGLRICLRSRARRITGKRIGTTTGSDDRYRDCKLHAVHRSDDHDGGAVGVLGCIGISEFLIDGPAPLLG